MSGWVEMERRQAVYERLLAAVTELFDRDDVAAVEILARHAERYLAGHKNYGAVDPVKDARSWLLELQAELDDACFYLQAQLMRQEAGK